MAKLEEHREEIVQLFASGMSKSEIAKKFQVSHTAISKILKAFKSFAEQEKVSKKFQKVSKQDNKEIAREIYNNAMNTLKSRVEKATPTELLKIIEYYNIMYNFAEEGSDEKVTSISITVEDGSVNDTED